MSGRRAAGPGGPSHFRSRPPAGLLHSGPPSPRLRPARGRARRSVLVADDEPSVRQPLGRVLRGAGFDVAFADDGREAVDRYRERRPDLVLMDCWMPKMSGADALAAIRTADPSARCCFVTGDLTFDPEGSGADGYLAKPFSLDELLATVARLAGAPAVPP